MCDVVVTWVDGNDEQWFAEKQKYQCSTATSGESFYRDWGLLRYWFRGMEKNLSWIRKIHFITYGHLPPWLNTTHPQLDVVRHEDFIPKENLPTFSSPAIEFNMNRINDLLEKFVYFNDDMFLMNCVEESFFFKNDLPADCLSLMPITDKCTSVFGLTLWNSMAAINRNFCFRECAEKNKEKWFSPLYPEKVLQKNRSALNWDNFPGFGYDHFPMPLLKSEFDEVWEKNSKLLADTCRNKVRSPYDAMIWLVRYWQLAKGSFSPAYTAGRRYVSVCDEDHVVRDTILNPDTDIICINDSESPIDFNRKSRLINKLMELRLPEMSSFEKI